jgi:general secretion pathway protein D
VISGTNFPGSTGATGILNIAKNPALLGGQGGLNIGVVKGSINIPGLGDILNLSVLAHALETEAQGNILSTPNLMTLDNEEAKIVVGQNVPILTGSYSSTGTATGSGTTPTPFQTFDRKDVGLTLKVKPQVSEGGLIKLNIFQEASSIDPASVNNPAGLTTNKRSIDTTVLVDDGSIIAIGGLIQETVSDSNDQVPLLGDIPGLGWLFKFQKKDHKKTNLMVFLKPTIVRDDVGARTLAGERYGYIIGDRQTNGQAKLPLDVGSMMTAPPINSGIQQGLDALSPAQPLSQPPLTP